MLVPADVHQLLPRSEEAEKRSGEQKEQLSKKWAVRRSLVAV